MKRTTFCLLTAAAGLSAMLVLSGCNTVTAGQARRNATPALATTSATRGQAANDMARVIDHNERTAWDDFKRIMLLDRPSSLHPYTIP